MAKIHIDFVADRGNVVKVVQDINKNLHDLSENIESVDSKTRKALDTPEKYLKYLEKSYKEAQAALEKYEKQLNRLGEQNLKAALKGDVSEVNRISAEMDSLSQTIQETTQTSAALKQELMQLGRTDAEIEKITSKGNTFKALFSVIGKGAGAAAAAMSVWLAKTASGQAVVTKLRDAFLTLQEKILGTSKELKQFQAAVRDGAVSEIVTLQKLQKEWEKANGNYQKQQKIVASTDWSKLGMSVNSVSQAEKILTDNTDAVVKALIARAKAAALIKKAEKEAAQAMMLTDMQASSNTFLNNIKQWAGDAINGNPLTDGLFNGIIKGVDKLQGWSNNQVQDAINKKNEQVEQALSESIDFDSEYQQIMGKFGAYLDSGYENAKQRIQNFRELRRRLENEQKIYDKAIRFDTRQAEIDALEEGSEKVRAQIKLNYEKEKSAIEDWYNGLRDEKYRKAKEAFEANPVNAGQAFSADINNAQFNATPEEQALRKAKDKANLEDRNRALKEQYDKDVQDFGDYEQKKAMLAEKWAKRIAQADKDGFGEGAREARDKELADLERQYSNTYGRIFADIDGASSAVIRQTIELAEKELAQLSRTGQATTESFKDLRDRIDQLKGAERSRLSRSYGTSVNDVRDVLFRRNLASGKTAQAQADLTNARALLQSPQKILKLTQALNEAKDKEKELNDELQKTIVLTGASGLGESLSIAGELLLKLGREEGEVISQLGNAVSGVVAQLAAGNVAGAIASGAVSAFNLLTDAINAQKQAMEAAADRALNYSIALQKIADAKTLSEYDTIVGTDERGAMMAFAEQAKAAKDNLAAIVSEAKAGEVEIKNWLKAIALFFSPGGFGIPGWISLFSQGDKVLGDLISDHRNGWQKFWGSSEGIERKSWSDFFDENGLFKGDELRAWYEANADGMSAEQRNLVDNLLAEWDRYKQGTESVFNQVKSYIGDSIDSAADEMIDNYLKTGNAIADMSDNMEEFALSQARALIKSALLKKFFDGFDEKQFIDNLTSGDENKVAQALEDYNKRMEALGDVDVSDILAKLGINPTGTDTTQQSSTGAFQTMSQDTASELNGRFTALQINSERGITILETGVSSLESILNLSVQNSGFIQDIREDVRKLVKEAMQIVQNTNNLTKL